MKSMKIYKQNLSILNHRYCDFEHRLLLWFYQNPDNKIRWLKHGFDILVMNLIKDGLLEDVTHADDIMDYLGPEDRIGIRAYWESEIDPSPRCYAITEKGKEFTKRWVHPESIE